MTGRFLLSLAIVVGITSARPSLADETQGGENVTANELQLQKVQNDLEQKRKEAQEAEQIARKLKSSLDKTKTNLEKSNHALSSTRSAKEATERRARERTLALSKAAAEEEMKKGNLMKLWEEYELSSIATGADTPERAFQLAMALGAGTELFMENVRQVETIKNEAMSLHNRTRELSQEERKRLEETNRALKTYHAQTNQYTDAEKRRQATRQKLKELESTANELNRLMTSLRKKAAAGAAGAPEGMPVPTHVLPWPVAGHIIKKFGKSRQTELGTVVVSNGIVISCKAGATVRAIAPGKVLYSGSFMSYGRIVLIEHSGDWHSIYGHLAGPLPEPGTIVAAGDAIGVSDTDAQIYLEMRIHGMPIDPLPWLQSR